MSFEVIRSLSESNEFYIIRDTDVEVKVNIFDGVVYSNLTMTKKEREYFKKGSFKL